MDSTPTLTPDQAFQNYTKTSIFLAFTQLSRAHKSVNLGHGFPNWGAPEFLQNALEQVVDQNISSDSHSFGCANLLSAVCQEYAPVFSRPLDPMKHVVVSSGAIGVLSGVFSGLSAQDEVVVIEPFFAAYMPILRSFRAKIKCVRLVQNSAGEFVLDAGRLKAAVNASTRWILLNSPHNPTGKVFSPEDYAPLTELAKAFPDLNFVSDEVYEKLCFKGQPLPRVANLPGLWSRTVSVFSGGKTFSCTGWRVGWAVGPEALIGQLKAAQHCTRAQPGSVVQETLSLAIVLGSRPYRGFPSYYSYLRAKLATNLRILEAALSDSGLGFKVVTPEAGYFLTVDVSKCLPRMPAYYLFSESSRGGKEHLRDTFLGSLEDYRCFKGTCGMA